MVLTVRASVIFLPSGVINVWGTAILSISLQVYSVIFLPSGVINVWGTAILFVSLQVYNNYKALLINYSILKLHPLIFIEAVSSYFTWRLHPPILY